MDIPAHHRNGANVLVECAIPGTANDTKFLPCTVQYTVGAADREYRVVVEVHATGNKIGPCAPECVVPLSTKS